MSNNNYMDKVPVKISEKFKPPPRIYQLPQVIANRLQLPVNYYNESPQFDYDFQLEQKVLAKVPEWRQMRQQEREARRERKERREQENLLQIEAKNKQMLGAVSYPSTDDLSSSDSESEDHKNENEKKDSNTTTNSPEGEPRMVLPSQVSSFHNILQPTIISNSNNEKFQIANATQFNLQSIANNSNNKAACVVKEINAFNYRDFEEDTSSPFDNIELKTINDLDILAQVLHNTQLPMQKEKTDCDGDMIDYDGIKGEHDSKDNTPDNVLGKDDNSITENMTSTKVLENSKVALQKNNFDKLGQKSWHNESIPNTATTNITNSSIAAMSPSAYSGKNSNTSIRPSSYASFPNPQQTIQQCYQMSYNTSLYNGFAEQQQQLPQQYVNYNVPSNQGSNATAYSNQHFLQGPINYDNTISAYCSPRHLQHHNTSTATAINSAYLSNNANHYGDPVLTGCVGQYLQNQQKFGLIANDYNDIDAKSKSVPDILKELSDEVRNSEIRRSRYYSFNSQEEEKQQQSERNQDVDEDITPKQSPAKVSATNSAKATNYYAKLPPPAQRLVKNISSMGFPLELVAKISQIFGTDDKKIIEHLIPLSELMDLGFDESKISDALMQFDNNKEKALEYLIS